LEIGFLTSEATGTARRPNDSGLTVRFYRVRFCFCGENLGLLAFFRGLLAVVFGAYLIIALIAAFFSDQMIFQPQPAGYRDDEGIIKLVSSNGAKISARYLANPNATFTMLFSHGNAEDIGDDEIFLQGIRSAGFSVFAYDYQGYGTSEGKPTERRVYGDVEAAYTYLVEDLHVQPNRIISFGRSLGGGPATDLAFHRPIAGLVLESSFTSAFRVLTRVPLLPFDRFNNLSKITRLHCPVLIIHGIQDSVIKVSHGRELFAAANDPKQALWVEGANHNDVPYYAGNRYSDSLKKFSQLVQRWQQERTQQGR
jgi:pimeloyl-ACP methyl ester carboxylesterase